MNLYFTQLPKKVSQKGHLHAGVLQTCNSNVLKAKG